MKPEPTPAPLPPPSDHCSRCGTRLAGPFCHECGTEVYGPRLDPVQMLRRTAPRLYWFGARLLRTLLDLTFRPAQVCWVYLSGQRDRYIQPVSYALSALVLEQLAQWALQGLAGLLDKPGAVLLIHPHPLARLVYVPTLLVIAVLWRVFFRRSGHNTVEMLAIVLYACAQTVVLWSAFALVVGLSAVPVVLVERQAPLLQLGLVFLCLTYTGRGVLRENLFAVAFKVALSVLIPVEVLAGIDSLLRHR